MTQQVLCLRKNTTAFTSSKCNLSETSLYDVWLMENFLKSNFCRTTNTTTNSKYSSARNTIKSSKNKENEQNELKKRRWTTNSWWNEKTPGTKQSPNSRSSVRGNRNVYELSIAPVACISTACANGSQPGKTAGETTFTAGNETTQLGSAETALRPKVFGPLQKKFAPDQPLALHTFF